MWKTHHPKSDFCKDHGLVLALEGVFSCLCGCALVHALIAIILFRCALTMARSLIGIGFYLAPTALLTAVILRLILDVRCRVVFSITRAPLQQTEFVFYNQVGNAPFKTRRLQILFKKKHHTYRAHIWQPSTVFFNIVGNTPSRFRLISVMSETPFT